MNQHPLPLRAGLVACAVASVFVVACSRDKPQDHLAKAKEMIAKNDHRGAVIELKNALQGDGSSTEARFMLGRELLAQGDSKNAEIELQKAFDQKYDPEAVVPPLVKAQLLQGENEKVVRQIAATTLKSPDANAELQTLLGIALFAQGKTDDAMKAFNAASTFVPDYADAQLGVARILASRGETDAAKTQVDAVLAKHPKLADGLLLRGDIARAKGSIPEAIDAYQAAIKENPRNFLARLNLAGAYIGSNKLDLAQEQIDSLKKEAPRHPGVTYLDGLIAFNKKDYQRANDAVAISLASAPTSGMAQMLAGAISTAMNQPAQAEQHLREALKANPQSVYARKLLTSLYLRQRQPQKADEILQPALQAAPNDGTLTSLAGEVALQRGDYAGASKFFDKSAKINPSDANVRTQGAAGQLRPRRRGGGLRGTRGGVEGQRRQQPEPGHRAGARTRAAQAVRPGAGRLEGAREAATRQSDDVQPARRDRHGSLRHAGGTEGARTGGRAPARPTSRPSRTSLRSTCATRTSTARVSASSS